MKQSSHLHTLPSIIGTFALSAALCLGAIAGPGAAAAYGAPTDGPAQQVVQPTGPVLSGIRQLGASLSPTQLTADGNGNFKATVVTDAASVSLSPRFNLDGLSAGAPLSLTITCGDTVERKHLAAYRDGSYGQASGVTRLSHPGKSQDVVTYELFARGQRFGALTVVFAAQSTFHDSVALRGLATPTVGGRPVQLSDLIAGSEGYRPTAITWYDATAEAPLVAEARFADQTAYRADITVRADQGHRFDTSALLTGGFTYDLGLPADQAVTVTPSYRPSLATQTQIVPGPSTSQDLALTVHFPTLDTPDQTAPNRLAAPQNVRIDATFLAWDAVTGAERYQIVVYRRTGDGQADQKWTVDSTSLVDPREPLAEISAFMELPSGAYRFAVRASTLHNGFWNATRASDLSAWTTEANLYPGQVWIHLGSVDASYQQQIINSLEPVRALGDHGWLASLPAPNQARPDGQTIRTPWELSLP